ncbi:Cupredoxin-like domain-containing protein [Roseovarius azorensis]|uniref:Cupredoxin-like domain-containing protein n=1 Tax=Roseovarius azorensis TaxID=1287727 RepID=A0A1H7MJM2_9RHOB|nr:cupredoxin domain-containing protein [Roseovarius azorensis]SEL11392.1 Cupredoxin-like domain-containing protein [Roseovarius azorensis]
MRLKHPFIALLTVLGTIGHVGAASSEPIVRHFTILAAEPKGGTNVAQEPFPAQPLPEGGGHVVKEPNAEGRWEVSSYVWLPSQIVVTQGDNVVLDFVGINGASHHTEIEGLGHAFTLRRGELARIEFVADRVGVFSIICHDHPSSMRGEIVVLPVS